VIIQITKRTIASILYGRLRERYELPITEVEE
jgi:hypothetical protein